MVGRIGGEVEYKVILVTICKESSLTIYEMVSPWKMVYENCVATHIGSEILVDFSKSRKRQKLTFPTERR